MSATRDFGKKVKPVSCAQNEPMKGPRGVTLAQKGSW